MPEDQREKMEALLVFAYDIKSNISNVHGPHDDMENVIREIHNALRPCDCDYCVPPVPEGAAV